MSIYRNTLLGIAGWGPLERFARRRGLSLGANRFVAGEQLQDGIRVARELHAQGKHAVLDLLGEFVTRQEDAQTMADGVASALRAFADVPGPRRLSVKPTQIGLGIDENLTLNHMRRLAEVAREAGVHLAMDMEDHPRVDATLRMLTALHDEGHTHVSTVLQSYLYRTPSDLDRLLERNPVPELRLVKGAYKEPADVAYPKKNDVDRAYVELADRMLVGGGLVHIATHDEGIIRHVQQQRDKLGVPKERVTFQLLYGVKPNLQKSLVDAGESVGIYLPFGADWYGYFTRRLAERPANLGFVLRGLVG